MGDGGYEGGGGESGQVPGDPGDDQCQLILDECLGANLPPDLCKEEFLSCIEGN